MSANNGSFCTWSIILQNGKEVRWDGDQEGNASFTVPPNARKLVKGIHSVGDLLDFVAECFIEEDKDEARKYIDAWCSSFRDEIQAIPNFDDIATISLAWGQFNADDGISPDEGCEGESLFYEVKTGKVKISHKPEKWFVEEMDSLYGDLFEDEDEMDDDWDEEDE